MKLKKIISLLTTMMVAAAPICSTSYVNATSDSSSTYLVGDINGNGVVDITDLPLMMQFLRGSLSADARTAERLDVNQDNIINKADYDNLVDRFFTNNLSTSRMYPSSMPSLPNQKNDGIVADGGVNYTIYSALSGTSITSYNLNSVDEITTNINSSRGIIGTDDRILEEGLSGVINVQYSNGDNSGTAFAVDEHTLLTAAHVIYQKVGNNIYVPNLKFYMFDKNNNRSTELHATYYHVPTYFIQNAYVGLTESDHTVNASCYIYDYALVEVTEELPQNFVLGIANSDFTTSDLRVTGYGHTGDNVNDLNIDKKTTGSGSFYQPSWTILNASQLLIYDTDEVGGDSGAPVYVYDANSQMNMVIGINTMEWFDNTVTPTIYICNQGLKINTDILHFVYNNPHL